MQYTYSYDAHNFLKSQGYRLWNSIGSEVTEGDSTYNYFHTNLGINDLKLQEERLVVYPNPSSDEITIETPARGTLSILDINGQQLLQKKITGQTTLIDISTLPGGVYFVKATGERTVQVGKVIKQ